MVEINENIFITEKRDFYYILYANNHYILFTETDKDTTQTDIKNVDSNPIDVIEILDNLDDDFKESDLPNEFI